MEYVNVHYGIYGGQVADNKDPDKCGRVTLKVPALYGEDVHNYWATPRSIPNGAGEGMFWVPKVGDKVWVTFENGDCRFPVWEHGYWGAPEEQGNNPLASLYDDDGSPTKRQLTTAAGQTLLFDDTNKLIQILDVTGNAVYLNETGISIVPKDGKKVSLGTLNGSKYRSVLGEELKKLLDETLNAIQSMTVMTMGGASSVPINAATFATIATKLDTMLSQVNTLE